MARAIRWVLWGFVAAALVAAALWYVVAPRMTAQVAGRMGHGDYQLTTTDGTPFTEASLKGTPSAVFFGYTHCTDVCPTTLGEVAGWQDILAKEGKKLRVYFVTVDPERDTLSVLKDYVSWVPGVVGVSGTPSEIAKAIKAFHIYAHKGPVVNGEYSMDHTASMLLFDGEGNFSAPIDYQEADKTALPKIRKILG
ncbi:MAG: SCO family protein [Paracoccaceae bacterium]|nr:SCO family protein [Paracoccaceae bacterium]